MESEVLKDWMSRFSDFEQKESGSAEVEKMRQEIRSYVENLDGDERVDFQKTVFAEMSKTKKDAQELIAILEARKLKAKLEPVLGFITLSEIASRYFNKSRHWLYARINGNIINGKPVRFTDEELITFQAALRDIAERLVVVSQNIR